MQTRTFLQLLFTSRWNCQSTLLQDLCSFAPCTSELFDKLCLAKLAVPFLHLHGYISYCFTFVVLHKQGFHSKVWLCIPIKLTSSFRAPLPLFQPSSQLSCMISAIRFGMPLIPSSADLFGFAPSGFLCESALAVTGSVVG